MSVTFSYKAKKPGGGTASGTVTAGNQSDAVAELRRQGLTIVSLQPRKGKGGAQAGGSFFSLSMGGGKKAPRLDRVRVKEGDMVVFTRQMATMISAGIPLVESIEILAEQASNLGFQACLENIASEVRAGKDLSQALGNHPKVFPSIYVNMIRAGEASGQLDIVLDRLADYQEASAALRAEIKSAMTYPIVSLVLVLGISAFLLVVIIPKFEEMFNSMDVELPAITVGLLDLSLFLKNYFLWWFAGLVLAFFLVRMYLKTDQGATFLDWSLLHVPIFGPLFSKVAISRFSRTFSTLIQSGVPILGALEIVASTSGNRIVSSAITKASESVRQGETLGEPLAASGVFPTMVTRMISIGEKTGALESLLEKISDFYDQQVKTTVEQLTSLIEPLMISIMGVLVGGMVMAIFLPIFKMVGSLSGK
ncbi:MAG: type II secretion system F family protein [Planctomycetes bacterium]|nr:type II secretion system F family protein [Planctomycetota bacterium]